MSKKNNRGQKTRKQLHLIPPAPLPLPLPPILPWWLIGYLYCKKILRWLAGECPHCRTYVGTIPTMFRYYKKLVYRHRMAKAVKWWNADIPILEIMANKTTDGKFLVSCLIWQEINMYCCIDEQVKPKEFKALCIRRGFSLEMIEYLKKFMIRLGLGKWLLHPEKQPNTKVHWPDTYLRKMIETEKEASHD